MKSENIRFSFWHDWTSFLPNQNWRDFTFLHFSIELNAIWKYFEIDFGILGFHSTLTFYKDYAGVRKEIDEFYNNITGAEDDKTNT